jgi:hypothetical protein
MPAKQIFVLSPDFRFPGKWGDIIPDKFRTGHIGFRIQFPRSSSEERT